MKHQDDAIKAIGKRNFDDVCELILLIKKLWSGGLDSDEADRMDYLTDKISSKNILPVH